MKKKIIFSLSFLLIIAFSSFAQQQYNVNYMFDYYLSNYKQYNIEENIQIQTISYTNKKGKVFTTKYEYNKNGSITKIYRPGNKSKSVITDSICYDFKVDKISNINTFKRNGKLKRTMNYNWNVDSLLLELSVLKSNGKIKYKSIWQYTDAKKIDKSIRYTKGGSKVANTWKYVYDDDNELLQSQLYKGDEEKLEYMWDFSCHQEGSELTKEKNTTQVCKWSEDDGKFLIKTYQRFDEKGNIRKYVSYYTLDDTTLIETKSFNTKDELVNYTKYNKDRKTIYYESFKNGKSIRKGLLSYNTNGDRTNYKYYKKEKLKREYIYEYNDKNKLVVEIQKSKGKLKLKRVYTYNDSSLVASFKHYNRKNELVGSSEYSYLMY